MDTIVQDDSGRVGRLCASTRHSADADRRVRLDWCEVDCEANHRWPSRQTCRRIYGDGLICEGERSISHARTGDMEISLQYRSGIDGCHEFGTWGARYVWQSRPLSRFGEYREMNAEGGGQTWVSPLGTQDSPNELRQVFNEFWGRNDWVRRSLGNEPAPIDKKLARKQNECKLNQADEPRLLQEWLSHSSRAAGG